MKYTLVLGGGGTKGSYEIGVFKALSDMNIEIDAVYGTSIGALNAALIAQGDINMAENLWMKVNATNVMNIEEGISKCLVEKGIHNTIEFIIHVIKSKGIDISPFRELVESVINEETVMKSKIDFGLVTFCVKDFTPVNLLKKDIPKGKLVDYLIASAALPAFKSHTIDNKRFLDGGIYDNVPLSFAAMGNNPNIIVVDIFGPGFIRGVNEKDLNITYIKNPYYLRGGILDFNKENIIFNMHLGYLDALRAFNRLTGYRYYIKIDEDIEKLTEKYISSLNEKDIIYIYSCFGIEINPMEVYNSKVLLNHIMSVTKRHSGEKILSKEAILKSTLEITAEMLSIEREKVYTINNLKDEIIKESKEMLESFTDDEYNKYNSYKKFFTSKAKVKSVLGDSINMKKYLAFYIKAHLNGENNSSFKRIVSMTLPKLSIAASFINLLIEKEEIVL